jgi:hypothetical protein
MNVGLAGITVYVPTAAVAPLTDNPGGLTAPPCDSCATLIPATVAQTVTGVDGSFVLSGVSAGMTTIVAQTGRWRRVVSNFMVTANVANPVLDDAIRMPKNQTEGDIPKMALVMGEREALECMLLKIGIDAAEISNFTSSSDTQRIQLFRTNGEITVAGTPQGHDDLFGTCTDGSGATCTTSDIGALNEYSAVILPCDSGTAGYTSAQLQRMKNYADAGGRLFMDHLTGDEILKNGPAPWNDMTVAKWNNGGMSGTLGPAFGKVEGGNAAQEEFKAWLALWAPPSPSPAVPYPGATWIDTQNPRNDAFSPGPNVTNWIQGESHNNWSSHPDGDYSLSFSFETPIETPMTTCGRVLYNGMHVSQSRTAIDLMSLTVPSTLTFPTSCDTTTPLTSEEKALEYQLFQLTACALGGAPAPPPPPPQPTTFTRDYEAVCGPQECPVWQQFRWQAKVPAGTTIDFRAATADDEADLPANAGAAPESVPVGQASMTVMDPLWDADTETVAQHLMDTPIDAFGNTTNKTSHKWLRMYMTLNPNAMSMAVPTLYSWQQFYDCVPCE